MPVTIKIPTPLQKMTGGQAEVSVDADSVGAAIDALEAQFNGVKERLCDEQGEVRRFVNVYVNGEDIRFAQGLSTALSDGDELSIVPAIAGGAG